MIPTENHRAVLLLAEDDVGLRNLLRTALARDYEVLAAANGYEALQLSDARDGIIDIVLSDIEMPGMDGVSLCRRIRASRPHTRTLLMSGAVLDPHDLAGHSLPCLPKPFDLNTLRRRLQQLLAEPELNDDPKVILIVDDHATRRARIWRILAGRGYRVQSVASLEEAALLVEGSSKIDLVVTAVVMGGKSGGIGLAERVDASRRPISTLLIDHEDPALLNLMPGFLAQPEFLPNPFTSEALLEHVGRLLQGGSAK